MKYDLSLIKLALVASLFTLCSEHALDTATAASEPPSPQLGRPQAQRAEQILDSMAKVKTRLMSLEEFAQAIQSRAGTNADNLSESQREKLFACLN